MIVPPEVREQLRGVRERLYEEIRRIDAILALDGGPLSSEEYALVRDGLKIEAIKAYRNRVGCSLVEARDAVEAAR